MIYGKAVVEGSGHFTIPLRSRPRLCSSIFIDGLPPSICGPLPPDVVSCQILNHGGVRPVWVLRVEWSVTRPRDFLWSVQG